MNCSLSILLDCENVAFKLYVQQIVVVGPAHIVSVFYECEVDGEKRV